MRKAVVVSFFVFTGFASLAPLSGCSGESRREATGAVKTKMTSAGAGEAACTRLLVVAVDLEREEGKHRITVKAKAPSPGWRAEIKALPVTEPATREFEIVGLPPEKAEAAGEALAELTVTRLETFDAKVEQVVVDSADGATVLPLN